MKNILKFFLLCIIIAGLTGTAKAEVWQEIHHPDYETDKSVTWLYDSESFKQLDDATYSVNIKAQYSDEFGEMVGEERQLPVPPSYFISTYIFNYKDKTYTALNAIFYDKNDNKIFQRDYSDEMAPFHLDLTEDMFNATFFYFNKYYRA